MEIFGVLIDPFDIFLFVSPIIVFIWLYFKNKSSKITVKLRYIYDNLTSKDFDAKEDLSANQLFFREDDKKTDTEINITGIPLNHQASKTIHQKTYYYRQGDQGTLDIATMSEKIEDPCDSFINDSIRVGKQATRAANQELERSLGEFWRPFLMGAFMSTCLLLLFMRIFPNF